MSVNNINSTTSTMSPLKNRLTSQSTKASNDNFSNILSQNLSSNKETTTGQTVNNPPPASFNLNTTTLNTNTANPVNTMTQTTSTTIDPSKSASSTTSTTSSTAASNAVKIDIKGDSISFTVDMSKANDISINVKKNTDGSYTFNISDKSSTNTNPSNTTPTTPTTPTNPTTPTTPTTPTPNTPKNSFELYDEEWMIPGRDYSNTSPAYSPVTGKPLNITLGEFYKMMDRMSWDPITKTHSGTPTGQSWAQFKEMLKYGLDPYITMFY